jgi:hypothetical protein
MRAPKEIAAIFIIWKTHLTPLRMSLENIGPPHPGPMASQARHESVAQQTAGASRIVVPSLGEGASMMAMCGFLSVGRDATAHGSRGRPPPQPLPGMAPHPLLIARGESRAGLDTAPDCQAAALNSQRV